MTAITFVPARDLKQRFHCFGYFYQLHLNGHLPIPCRSILELLDQSLPNPTSADTRIPDAVAIMMNPGSSQPLTGDPLGPIRDASSMEPPAGRTLVPTRPDTTQYQVMRIMLMIGWQHVRVVNLSDIREPNSPTLFQRIAALREQPMGNRHSLFSDARTMERNSLLGDPAIPIIAGWGRDPALEPLAQQCRQSIGNREIIGLSIDGRPLAFGHPSPRIQARKLAWLATIHEQLSFRNRDRI